MVLTLSILLCILLLKHTSAFLLLSQQYHHHQNHHTLETLFKFRLFSSSTFQKDEDNYDAEARGEWIRFAPKGRSFGHDADNRYLKFGRMASTKTAQHLSPSSSISQDLSPLMQMTKFCRQIILIFGLLKNHLYVGKLLLHRG